MHDRRLWLGLGIVLVGLVSLINNLHIFSFEFRRYVFTWEAILMAIGTICLFRRGCFITGVILLFVGTAFYLRNVLHLIGFNLWEVFFPAVLICAGIMIIFKHAFIKSPEKKTLVDDGNMIDEIAFFGGGDRIINSQQFMGGKVTTVFGGLNFNLLKAKLAPGDNYIDVFCLFGGIKLIVPDHWDVKIKVVSAFGGFSDKHRLKGPVSDFTQEARLILRGTAIFGGGDIKGYLD